MPELPSQLLNSLERLPHFNSESFIESHNNGKRETSVRTNPFKKTELSFPVEKAVPWCSEAFYLQNRPSFTLDPLFHAGCYYVQEPGSMFLELALRNVYDSLKGLTVLDLCAAPGGKSTHLNSLLQGEGVLVSNELIKARVPSLVHNLGKWGTNNSIVTSNEASRFCSLTGYFDVVVVDAPCSGSGLFRKQPEAINEWSEKNVEMCSVRQRQILDDILPALKGGGHLFYSTCSYSVEENEKIVQWLIHEKQMVYVPLKIEKAWGIVETELGYRFYPDKTASEGFFCALLIKTEDEKSLTSRKYISDKPSRRERDLIAPFLAAENGDLITIQGRHHFVNTECARMLDAMGGKLYLKKAGVYAGEIKGSDLVPSQELAWSIDLSPELSRAELSVDEALNYLRKQAFSASAPGLGLHAVTYQGLALGWAKFIGSRINNYLPSELRILK